MRYSSEHLLKHAAERVKHRYETLSYRGADRLLDGVAVPAFYGIGMTPSGVWSWSRPYSDATGFSSRRDACLSAREDYRDLISQEIALLQQDLRVA